MTVVVVVLAMVLKILCVGVVACRCREDLLGGPLLALDSAEVSWLRLLNGAEIAWLRLLDSAEIAGLAAHHSAEISWLRHLGCLFCTWRRPKNVQIEEWKV